MDAPARHTTPLRTAWFGLLAVWLFSLFALLPLIAQPGLPNGSDVLYHVYRVAEMDRSWEAGTRMPSWAAGLYYGYGSPLWHFYANLAYWLSSGLMGVFGLSALDALRWLLVGSYFALSTGMYLFARGQIGVLGGVIAAVVYLYSPYIIYTEPYARGTYPELLAFAIFPFVMWRFAVLLRSGRGLDAALAAITLCLLILAHNLMALALTALLAGWIIWNAVATRLARGRMQPYALAGAALLLGIGLAAFFWLPVLLEADTVNLRNLTGVALLDYRNFFVPLPDLFGSMPLPDVGSINGLRNVTTLGIAQWLLALAGLLTLAYGILRALRAGRHDDPLLRQGVYFALLALIMLFSITPTARPLWEALRFLPYLQFPWRLLGPIAFCLAFLAGLNALWLRHLPPRLATLCIGLVLAGIVLFAAPAFVVPEWRFKQVDTSIAAYHAAEAAGLQRGTTFTGEYRPRAVFTLPGPTPRLLADYADGYPINRANAPAGVQVTLLDSGVQHNVWQVSSDAPFTFEVLTFAWAGWQASIDGHPVPIAPSPEHGLITLPVPAGEHIVRVQLGLTPARTFGNVVSIVALVLTLALARRFRQAAASNQIAPLRRPLLEGGQQQAPTPTTRPERLGMLLGAALTLPALWVVLAGGNVWHASAPASAIPATHDVRYHLGEHFQIIGYDVNSTTLKPGDTLNLTLYWYASAITDVNFSSFVHVALPATPPIAQADKLHPGGRAIREWWSPAGYVHDAYRIRLPEGMPAGTYQVFVGLYTCELLPPGECGNGYRPPVRAADGTPLGDSVPLLTITVEA